MTRPAPFATCTFVGRRLVSAFTTPELLMTILVFSFGLLPLIVLFQTSYKTTAKAKNLMVAQSLGRSIIDEIRSYGFEGVSRRLSELQHSSKVVEGPLVTENADGIKYPDYYRRFRTSVQIDPDDPAKPTKFRVALTINWQEPDRNFSLGFGTVVVKLGAKQ